MTLKTEFVEAWVKWTPLFERYKLTDRQGQTCRLAALGNTDGQIGGQLGIHSTTVKAHMRAVYLKLGVNTRHHILLLMLEQSYQYLKDQVGQKASLK